MPQKIKVIADPVHGPIPYTAVEHKVLSSRVFNRLHNVLQNSMAYYVYPSTKTSRFTHSLGVMYLATEIFTNGCLNANPEDLTDFLQTINSEFKGVLYKIKIKDKIVNRILSSIINPHVRMAFANRLQQLNIDETLEITGRMLLEERVLKNYALPVNESLLPTYYISLQVLRLFGLLHDCGHLPFSHVMEFTLESLWDKLEEKTELNVLEENVKNILDHYCSGKERKKIHEELSLDIIDYIFYDEIIKNDLIRNDSAPHAFDQIVTYATLCELTMAVFADYRNFTALQALHKIISSDLDADRLDFISRDGKASGLLDSTGDISRIIKFIKLAKIANSNRYRQFHFMPSIQTLNDVEQVLTDRFIIYKYLVCHHKVIRFDYLVEKSVNLLIELEINKLAEKGKTEIDEKINIGKDILQLVDILNKKRNLERRMYRLSQIDDFWLMNVLRGKYFEFLTTLPHELSEAEKHLLFLLDEIFTGSRKFKSSWKRDHQFFDFVEIALSERGNEIAHLIEGLNYPEIASTTEIVQKIRKFDNYDRKSRREICVKFMELLDLAIKLKKGWLQTFTLKLERELQDTLNCTQVLCTGTAHKLSTGIKDLKLYAYDERGQYQIVDICDVSNIPQHLDNIRKSSTRFIVYTIHDPPKTLNTLVESFINILKRIVDNEDENLQEK